MVDPGSPTRFTLREDVARDGVTRLILCGEFDLAVVDQVRNELRNLAARHRTVALDLSGVEFIDSTAIGMLLHTYHGASRDGWDLTIEPTLNEEVLRVFKLIGIDTLLSGDEQFIGGGLAASMRGKPTPDP